MNESQILLLTAASIAFLHTILGPDHYVVFTAMGRARRWSLSKTLTVTAFCGLGHVLSSILIGAVGLLLGAQLLSLMAIEGLRGNVAGWALMSFGLMYLAWGLRKAGRAQSHSHIHSHDDVVHTHMHDHGEDHVHVHDATARNSITPWAMFIIFMLGPCEALIPLFMYPAAQQSGALVFAVALVFGAVTLMTMLGAVALTTVGIRRLQLASLGRWEHAIAGASVAVCGGVVTFM
jgi:sulfite exporter TauE/SafE